MAAPGTTTDPAFFVLCPRPLNLIEKIVSTSSGIYGNDAGPLWPLFSPLTSLLVRRGSSWARKEDDDKTDPSCCLFHTHEPDRKGAGLVRVSAGQEIPFPAIKTEEPKKKKTEKNDEEAFLFSISSLSKPLEQSRKKMMHENVCFQMESWITTEGPFLHPQHTHTQ